MIAIVAAFIAAGSAFANFLMWQQMREANRHARESFEIARRPFLQVMVGTTDSVRLDRTNPLHFKVVIENKGAGAASDLSVHRGLIQLHGAHIFTWRKVPDPVAGFHSGLVSLGPGGFVNADDTATPVADANLHQLYFAVCVIYRDDFNVWHRYVIAYRYDVALSLWHLWGDRREAGITPSADFLRQLEARA